METILTKEKITKEKEFKSSGNLKRLATWAGLDLIKIRPSFQILGIVLTTICDSLSQL